MSGVEVAAELLLVTGLVLVAVTAWLLTRAMVRIGELPDSQPLVIALAVLTLVALLGAIVTGRQEAYTLAATGIGAIAGGVTATWSARARGRRDEDQGE